MFILIAIIVVIAIPVVILSVKLRNFGKRTRKRITELGAVESFIVFHVRGLPTTKGVKTLLFACPDKLVIESKGQKFEIENTRITSIYKSDREKNYLVVDYKDKNNYMSTLLFESKGMNIDYFAKKLTDVINRSKGIDSNASVTL